MNRFLIGWCVDPILFPTLQFWKQIWGNACMKHEEQQAQNRRRKKLAKNINTTTKSLPLKFNSWVLSILKQYCTFIFLLKVVVESLTDWEKVWSHFENYPAVECGVGGIGVTWQWSGWRPAGQTYPPPETTLLKHNLHNLTKSKSDVYPSQIIMQKSCKKSV